ncbi:unnamed protein product [Phytomonas sp. Hart1]|nr:unnamed protein product [Phytomonas sp. Hart1]|eukprot:CCW68300.1 unnamed protein product [Phytomonas sp. isolate Hart1]
MNLPGIVDFRTINSIGLFSPNMWNFVEKETERSYCKNASTTLSDSPQLRRSEAVGDTLDKFKAPVVGNGKISDNIFFNREASSPATTPTLCHQIGSDSTDTEGGYHLNPSFSMPYATEGVGFPGASLLTTQPSTTSHGKTLVGTSPTLSAILGSNRPTHIGARGRPPGAHPALINNAAPILNRRFSGAPPTSAWGDHLRREPSGASATQQPSSRALPTSAEKEVSRRFGAVEGPNARTVEVVRVPTTTTNAKTRMSTPPVDGVGHHSDSPACHLFLGGPPSSSVRSPSPDKQQNHARLIQGGKSIENGGIPVDGGRTHTDQGSPQGSSPSPAPGTSDSFYFDETAVTMSFTMNEAPLTMGDNLSLRITHAEVQQVFEAFCARYESYQRFKSQCIEAYLTKIEKAVDQYLVRRFKPKKHTDNVLSKAGDNIIKIGAKLFRTATNSTKSRCPRVDNSSSLSTSPARNGTPMHTPGGVDRSGAPEMPARPNPTLSVPSFSSTEVSLPLTSRTLPLLSYTANVILSEYLDARPDEHTLNAVRQNYPILLHVLKNVFSPPPGDAVEGTSEDGGGHDVEEHAALHGKLIAPLIDSIWREYFLPLEMRLEELLLVVEQNVLPAYHQCEAPSGEGTLVNDLQRVRGLQRSLREDLAYVGRIRAMDRVFSADPARGERTYGLSDYVPVYGLILSRLHRLEMEHRSVLELWAGKRPASASALAAPHPDGRKNSGHPH